jgi:hypothetical protein
MLVVRASEQNYKALKVGLTRLFSPLKLKSAVSGRRCASPAKEILQRPLCIAISPSQKSAISKNSKSELSGT